MRRVKKASNTGLSRWPRSKINHTCWDYLTWTVEQHNTLHYDETSKEGFKYGSIQVATEQDQSYVLGLFDMDGGSAWHIALWWDDGRLQIRVYPGRHGARSIIRVGIIWHGRWSSITHCIMMRRAKKASNTGLSRWPRSKINHTCWDYLTWTVETSITHCIMMRRPRWPRSKEGFKYGSTQVTTEQDQSYVLGLFDMDGGTA